jgi:HEAT repeat protein
MYARTSWPATVLALCLVLTASGSMPREEGPKDVQALAKGLKAARPAKRIKAAEALGKLGRKAEGAAAALCLAAADPDEDVRHAALEALETVAPAIQKHVVTLAVDEEVDHQVQAGASLLTLGGKAAPAAPLIREHVRLATAAARGGKRAPLPPLKWFPPPRWFGQNFELLLKHLPDEQTVRVIAAVAEIDPSGFRDERTVQELRCQVIESLGQLGKAKKDLRKPITGALLAILPRPDYQPWSSDASTQAHVVRALRAFGPAAKEALPALRKLRYHPQAHVRAAAAEAIKAVDK